MSRQLGIAIATYERPLLTIQAYERVYTDPRVEHVSISDDASLLPCVAVGPKITIERNLRNLGSWVNKRKAVELNTSEWVALIDSDNTVGVEYLDALYALPEWDSDVLYLPVCGIPALNYEVYVGLMLDRESISAYLHDALFQMALNTGNFFVNRARHLQVSGSGNEEPHAACSMYFVYLWLASGRRLLVTPNLSYWHLVHDGSYWMQTAAQSTVFANELIRRMSEWRVAA